MKNVSRKSLYYANELKKNSKVKIQDFLNLRPGTGISSFEAKNLINKKLKKNVKFQELVSKKDFYNV